MTATISVQVIQPSEGLSLLRAAEIVYVQETDTGLVFASDTPLEVWGALVERLIRQHKRIEWAIGDAINFAEQAYEGHKYEQWIEQTGLSENTLSTMRWVAERIDPLRRRKDVGWSHHREVAALAPAVQDRLLEEAADKGMTRWEVRQAAKVEREKAEGLAVDATGAPVEPTESLVWVPQRDELTDEACEELDRRLAGMGKQYRIGYERAWLDCLLWTEQREMFLEWKA